MGLRETYHLDRQVTHGTVNEKGRRPDNRGRRTTGTSIEIRDPREQPQQPHAPVKRREPPEEGPKPAQAHTKRQRPFTR